jgi:hypothetical protein
MKWLSAIIWLFAFTVFWVGGRCRSVSYACHSTPGHRNIKAERQLFDGRAMSVVRSGHFPEFRRCLLYP